MFPKMYIQRILGECLLISRLPGKALRTLVDIARLVFHLSVYHQTSDYDVTIDDRVDSASLVMSLKSATSS